MISSLWNSAGLVSNERRTLIHGRTYRQILDNYKDLQYYSTVNLGDQHLKALIDISSFELVVFSGKCKFWCGPEKKNYYKAWKSSAYMKGFDKIIMNASNGTLFGNDAYDSFSIGPFGSHVQPFWEITDANMVSLFDFHYDAILGLAPVPPHVDVLKRGRGGTIGFAVTLPRLHVRKFSLCLDWRPGFHGYIKWNDDIFKKNPDIFVSMKLKSHGFWFAELEHVYLGDLSLGCSDGCGAIFDTTSPMLGLPSTSHDVLTRFIEQGIFGCNDMQHLPNLKFTLGGKNFSLPPDSYFSQVEGLLPPTISGYFVMPHNLENSSNICRHSVFKMNASSPFGNTWILGLPFFRSYYTVFEQTNPPKVHFAPAPAECSFTLDSTNNETSGYGTNQATARMIDVSNMHLPFWVRNAKHLGHIPDGDDTLEERQVSTMKQSTQTGKT